MKEIMIKSVKHTQFIDITKKVQKAISPGFSGTATLYTPHTTAAICVNEGADPNVLHDLEKLLDKLAPWNEPYFKHAEGNSAAHIKAVLVGNSQQVLVKDGQIQLGTWERIFFCEFDGPRQRNVWIGLAPE